MTTTRTLFSVVEVTTNDGETHCQVDWHPDVNAVLDDISPNYHFTDRLIDIAEEILGDMADLDEADDELAYGSPSNGERTDG